MEEFIYDETKYIKRKDLKEFNDLMEKNDFNIVEIQSEVEFNIAKIFIRFEMELYKNKT